MEKGRTARIADLEARLNELGNTIETTIHEDRTLLMHIDRIAAHCKRTLDWMDEKPQLALNNEKPSTEESSSEEGKASLSSSTTDTSSDKEMQPSISNSSPDSWSALEARELFPIPPPSARADRASPSSTSSNPSPRTHSVRKIAHSREQQVRTIMSDMQKRMKRQHSA